MKITVMTADEHFITLDVDRDEYVENLKALLEVETRVPLQQQQLLFDSKEMRNSDKLSVLGVYDGDLVMMFRASTNDLAFNLDGSAVNPYAFQQRLRNDSNIMAQLFQNDPKLAQVLLGNDLDSLQELLCSRHYQRAELMHRQDEELALLHADPFDVYAQRKIEAAIHQQCIDENWAAALEYNPEGFAKVVLPYVDMEVNGVPLKALVDSGAVYANMSKSCAERCRLMTQLDTQYKGIVKGVGQAESLGRIHDASIKIGNISDTCSFTVLEALHVECLLGLDMLRKLQCMIDLKDNVLRVAGGEVVVPFLQEKDITSHAMKASSSGELASSGSKESNDTIRRFFRKFTGTGF